MASAKQLAMMARVLEAYCKHISIPEGAVEREQLALEILVLFDNGFREEDVLLAELIRRGSPSAGS